jgi:RHS repeat-associated protein
VPAALRKAATDRSIAADPERGPKTASRRIAKRVYSSATGGTVAYTRFVYHGSQVAFETDSAGTIGLRYTWGLEVDDLVGVCTAPCNTEANHYYVTVDQLRNVREVTRRDGTWLLSRRFGPYGAQIEEAGAVSFELRYRWTGREYDAETGLYFFRSRYYDVAARRFVQEDPVGYLGGRSLYQYGEGNPLSGRDPDGLRMNNDVYWSQRDANNTGAPDYGSFGGGDPGCWESTTSASVTCMLVTYGIGGGGSAWFDFWWYCFYDRGASPGAECEYDVWQEQYPEARSLPPAPAVSAVTVPNLPALSDPRCARGGFPFLYCTPLVNSIDHLIGHGDPDCVLFGNQARARLAGGTLRYDARNPYTVLPDGRIVIRYGYYAGGNVYLTSAPFTEGNVTFALAHEMSHPNYGPSEDLANAFGGLCSS